MASPEEIAAAQQAAADKIAKKGKAKYRVLRPLSHNKTNYPVSAVLELNDEHALPLLASQVVEVATEEVPLT